MPERPYRMTIDLNLVQILDQIDDEIAASHFSDHQA